MSVPRPTTSDPTPEQRVGDSSIKPVVIAFLVTILIILVAPLIFIKARQTKTVLKATDPHSTTQTTPHTQPPTHLRLAIVA
jgi:hypothetical protein